MSRAVILDIDGTLIDSAYHHAIAWDRALREFDAVIPMWKIHRHIGMGGDKIVAELAGEEVEERAGDAVRDAQAGFFDELAGEIRVLDGARELIAQLKRGDRTVVLASSASEDEVERYLDLLGVRDQVDAWTHSDDVESSKPSPDLVEVSLDKAGTREAIMVGDTVWDVKAAKRAGIETVGVLTGGFSEAELRREGAIEVYESVVELRLDIENPVLSP